jgi:aspartyl-tRNA(Asn)/glutamyl-tRNA(Gln) amidotransferase subunit B
MNSFRAVERALTYEAQRQYDLWQDRGVRLGAPGGHKTTRGWDENRQVTYEQRAKEESSDYRYFPDPDLVPLTIAAEEVESIRARLGELPAALRARLETAYGITAYDADVLVNQGRPLVDYYVAVADACGDGKAAGNWIQQDVLRWLNEREASIDEFPVSAGELASLLKTVAAGELTTGRGREVLAEMIERGGSVEQAMTRLGIEKVDDSALETLCRQLLEANPKVVDQVKEGKEKAVGSLIGQAKKSNPNVDPGRVKEVCLALIAGT